MSAHAVTRFRERVEEELLHWGDDELGVLLNDRIRSAMLSRKVADPRDSSVPTTLYLFESRTGKRFVAVVRENCVVTILDAWMAQNNYPGWEEQQDAHIYPPPAPVAVSATPAVLTTTPVREESLDKRPQDFPDMYVALATECRELGQHLRALREQRSALDIKIEETLKIYKERRERLLALMDEGTPA